MAEKRLGRGLDYLISRTQVLPEPLDLAVEGSHEGPRPVPLAAIRPNPVQPRREFAPEAMAELESSVREHGVLQPIVLRSAGDGYEIVAGERRWRAASAAGLKEIPAVVREVSDDQMLALALVENLQREDLNAMETARAYRDLLRTDGTTQEALARVVGKSRTAIANAIRLLDLPADLQDHVSRGTLSAGHARALLAVGEPDAMRVLASRVLAEGLSVREAERAAAGEQTAPPPRAFPPPRRGPRERSPHLVELEQRLRQSLGTRALVKPGRGKRGKIVLYYASLEDFDRLFEILAGPVERKPVEPPAETRYL